MPGPIPVRSQDTKMGVLASRLRRACQSVTMSPVTASLRQRRVCHYMTDEKKNEFSLTWP